MEETPAERDSLCSCGLDKEDGTRRFDGSVRNVNTRGGEPAAFLILMDSIYVDVLVL